MGPASAEPADRLVVRFLPVCVSEPRPAPWAGAASNVAAEEPTRHSPLLRSRCGYDIKSWLGTGRTADADQYWRVWGRRRAQKLADGIVRDYKEQDLRDFEVCIFEARGDALIWFFSTDREREGLPRLGEGIE